MGEVELRHWLRTAAVRAGFAGALQLRTSLDAFAGRPQQRHQKSFEVTGPPSHGRPCSSCHRHQHKVVCVTFWISFCILLFCSCGRHSLKDLTQCTMG